MNKKLVSLVSAVSIFSMTAVNVLADNTTFDPWKVSFDGKKITEYNSTGAEAAFGGDDTQDLIETMQPGDSIEISINVENKHKTKVEWYLSNKVIENFEDSERASGGAYTYELTYTKSTGGTDTLFNSDTVGGDESVKPKEAEAGDGLEEATNALDEYIFLEEMGAGKSGKVTLKVALDGETQGNSYQVTAAKLNMLFAVEVPPTRTPEPKEEVIVTHQDRIIYLPNTGDDSNIFLYIAGFFVSLYIMVYAGWRLKRASRNN